MMTKELIAGIVALAGVAGGGWQANEYLHRTFASRDSVIVAGAKADYTLNKQMESLIAQIAHLERKQNKTRDEIEHLRYLREEYKRMQDLQRGK